MHFPIICLEKVDTPVEEWRDDLPDDDSTLLANTDYYGELYTPEERDSVIQSRWLKELFEGIAIVDPITECLYFKDAKTIRKTFDKYLKDVVAGLQDKADHDDLIGYDLRTSAKRYKKDWTLFFYEYGYTSFAFMEDAVYLAGETLRIGNVFDAHI